MKLSGGAAFIAALSMTALCASPVSSAPSAHPISDWVTINVPNAGSVRMQMLCDGSGRKLLLAVTGLAASGTANDILTVAGRCTAQSRSSIVLSHEYQVLSSPSGRAVATHLCVDDKPVLLLSSGQIGSGTLAALHPLEERCNLSQPNQLFLQQLGTWQHVVAPYFYNGSDIGFFRTRGGSDVTISLQGQAGSGTGITIAK